MDSPTKKWWRDSGGKPHTCLDWHPHRGRAHNCFSCGATPDPGVRVVDELSPGRQVRASAALEGRVVPDDYQRPAAVQEFIDGRTSQDARND